MRYMGVVLFALTMVWSVPGCGPKASGTGGSSSNGLTCGPGTHAENGMCVPDGSTVGLACSIPTDHMYEMKCTVHDGHIVSLECYNGAWQIDDICGTGISCKGFDCGIKGTSHCAKCDE